MVISADSARTGLMNGAPNIAVFCDFENVALGARESKHGVLDIDLVLKRLLDKGQMVDNCDEFIYYDDLVRQRKRKAKKSSPNEPRHDGSKETRGDKQEAFELILEIVESLFQERDDQLWGSMVKQTLKRKRPTFAESHYGYRTFSQLLEDAARANLLQIEKDERSGGYVILDFGPEADG